MFESDIIESANLYLTAKDKNFKYLYCNEKIACALNLDSPKSIIGKTDYDLYPFHLANIFRQGDERVLNGGLLLNEKEIHPCDNTVIKILTNKNQLKDKRGTLKGVVVSFVDISALQSNFSPEMMKYDQLKKAYHFNIGKDNEYFNKTEYDVFKCILTGSTAKEIGKKLTLSHRTIEDYIEKIKHKLQCTSKHHIIECAMRLGIVQQNIIET